MKRMYICLCIALGLYVAGCEQSATDDYYYQQQDDNEHVSEEISQDIDLELAQIFSVIQANGIVDKTRISNASMYKNQLDQLPTEKFAIDKNFPLVDFENTDFSSCVLRAYYDEYNVMHFSYTTNTAWTQSENNFYLQSQNISSNNYTYESLGPDIGEGMTLLSPMMYYKYEGYNPLFLVESNYNSANFGDTYERGMQRFIFYRFVGMGGGILEVDTLLFAVDTYTSLIFIYAIPTELDFVMGMPITTLWGSVDIEATDENGEKHLFFEYDPIGYVDSNYNFVMYQWYIDRNSTIDPSNITTYYPRFTGISPYLIECEAQR